MNSVVIINILLILFLLWIVFRRFLPVQGVKQITTTDLKSELKNKGKQFIDVRTPHEFRTGHIKGFKNIPLSKIGSSNKSTFERPRSFCYLSKWDEKSKGEQGIEKTRI